MIASIYSTICLFLPFFEETVLLHEAWYPPGWDRNFMFKLIHVFQSLLAIYTDLGMICAYDLLYVTLCINCSAQFQLLCGAMELIGSGNDKDAISSIQACSNDIETPSSYHKGEKDEIKLLSICVNYHLKLIQ